jgi:hypothetical protein
MSTSERQSDADLSEADYLAREVADAKAALSKSLAELKLGLTTSADLRQWVKYYPWASLGAAAAAGFAAATAVTPAQGESVKEKLARWKPDMRSTADDDGTTAANAAKAPRRASVSDNVINSVFDLAKVLVQTMIVATFQRPAPTESNSASPAEPQATRMAEQWPASA